MFLLVVRSSQTRPPRMPSKKSLKLSFSMKRKSCLVLYSSSLNLYFTNKVYILLFHISEKMPAAAKAVVPRFPRRNRDRDPEDSFTTPAKAGAVIPTQAAATRPDPSPFKSTPGEKDEAAPTPKATDKALQLPDPPTNTPSKLDNTQE